MARNIRFVDSPAYSRGGFMRPNIDVVETDGRIPYRRRWSGGEPLLFILILGLLAIWMYRNSGWESFGKQFGIGTSSSRSVPPVDIETAPVVPPVAPVEEAPEATAEQSAVITAERQSDIMGYSRVVSDSLNLRAHPGFDRRVIAVLPKYWDVAILRQSHITPNGDVWVEVMAETDHGWLKGWVLQRYLEACNCPA